MSLKQSIINGLTEIRSNDWLQGARGVTNKENGDKSKWLNGLKMHNEMGSVLVEGYRRRQNVVLSDKKRMNELDKQAIIFRVC